MGTAERLFLEGRRPYLWIAAAAIILYAKSLSFGYTFLDDNILILRDYAFLKEIANIVPAFFRKVFYGSYLPYYRPLLTVSLMIDAQIGGVAPFMYHMTNIAAHAAASCLVFALLERLGYLRLPSFLFSAIFAVHPVLSQGVAWIPGRNDTIMAVFAIASFLSLVGLLRTGRRAYYAGHLTFLVLALFTKETALMLIPVSLVYLYAVARERLFSRRCVFLAAGWAAAVLLWYACRQAAVRGSMEFTVADAWPILLAYLPAAAQFTGKIFFPVNLSVFPTMEDTTYVWGSVSIALLLLALLFTKERRYGRIVFGLAWAVLFLLPSLVRANYRISADFIEHRVYVPMIGFFILLLETDLVKKARRPAMVAAGVAAIAGCAFITSVHIDNFRDRLAFWGDAVRTSPHSPFAHMAMGNIHYESGRLDEAAGEYRKALALDPLEPGSWFGLGEVYLKKGMLKEAEVAFRKTAAVYPFYDDAYLELGVVYYKQARRADAERSWLRALEINPGNAGANKFLAILYQEQGDRGKAAYHARRLRAMGVEPPADFMRSLGPD